MALETAKRILILWLVFSASVYADTPAQVIPLDINTPRELFSIGPVPRGTTPSYRFVLYQNGTVWTNWAGWGWTLNYYTNRANAYVSITNSSLVHTNGTFDIRFTAQQSNPTGAYYAASIRGTNGTEDIVFDRGSVEFVGHPPTEGALAAIFSTNINFAPVQSYSGVALYGPYLAGTNVTLTPAANGAQYINASVTGGSGDLTGISNYPGSVIELTNADGPVPGIGLSTGRVAQIASNGFPSTVDWVSTDDLTTATVFTGDVAGVWNNLQLQADVVGSNEVATGAIGTSEIIDGGLFAVDVAAGGLDGSRLASGTVSNALIAASAVTGDKIADGTVSNADLAVGSVANTNIAWGGMPAGLQDGDNDTTYDLGGLSNSVAFIGGVASNGQVSASNSAAAIIIVGAAATNAQVNASNAIASIVLVGGNATNAQVVASNAQSVANAALPAASYLPTGGVISVAGLKGNVTLASGPGMTITTNAQELTLASTASGGGGAYVQTGVNSIIGTNLLNSISAASFESVVSGGGTNSIVGTSPKSFIGGGVHNIISNAPLSVIGGGGSDIAAPWTGNRIISDGSVGGHTIGGGMQNVINDGGNYSGTIAGGNKGSGTGGSFIGGGERNIAGSYATVVVGGFDNKATNAGAVVVGGNGNTAAGNHSTVGGGQGNSIPAGASYAVVSGGFGNNITDGSSDTSTIGGGEDNDIDATPQAVIAGGTQNDIGDTSTASAIGGGQANAIIFQSSHSAIPGGYSCQVTGGPGAFAAGFYARAVHEGAFVWSDRSLAGAGTPFPSTRSNEVSFRAYGGTRHVDASGEHLQWGTVFVTNVDIRAYTPRQGDKFFDVGSGVLYFARSSDTQGWSRAKAEVVGGTITWVDAY